MGTFRKRPVEIQAERIVSRLGTVWDVLPDWIVSAYEEGTINFRGDEGVDVVTREGVMHGDVGDWLIRGVAGELYPCKPDIFAATYEAV